MNEKLKLVTGSWYGWQMIPGYLGERCVPYCSPIFLQGINPKKTGKNILNVQFINVFYAEGVQDFSINLKIIKHEKDYIIAELLYEEGHSDRAVVISHIEFAWIERFCPQLWYHRPPSSVSEAAGNSVSVYLNEIFRSRKDDNS